MRGKYPAGKSVLPFLAAIFIIITSGSCGIEDYVVIYPVPQSNITQQLNNHAIVRIPNNNSSPPFSHFVIFYRIYVSDYSEQSPTPGVFNNINSELNRDYVSISPLIDSETQVNNNMESIFLTKGYKYLYLEGGNLVDTVLSTPVLGSILVFDFSAGDVPTMTIGGTNVYRLWRSNGNGIFSPKPTDSRYFMNYDDIWDPQYINSNDSADVVNKAGISPGATHYTYAAMFIVAVGMDISTHSYIYSTPSLIHVFQLPQP